MPLVEILTRIPSIPTETPSRTLGGYKKATALLPVLHLLISPLLLPTLDSVDLPSMMYLLLISAVLKYSVPIGHGKES